ncbi:MbtH family protein [Streptomyces sp. NBC_00582]|uniref:MbtH family protein n=1 Tax=Streptomyces sp. NBC_00582 TaxID=2975783 RepID=UPI0010627922|nr:MbtH family protein [Streptomyces sp. NBC_00582]
MFDDENAQYLVVINGEEQYSIWPAVREVPSGWTALGGPRPRQECLDHIEREWTDMRPKSVRDALENAGSLIAQGSRMVLSQLVDADELKAMSPEELRNMLASLDDDLIYGEDGEVIEHTPGSETA